MNYNQHKGLKGAAGIMQGPMAARVVASMICDAEQPSDAEHDDDAWPPRMALGAPLPRSVCELVQQMCDPCRPGGVSRLA